MQEATLTIKHNGGLHARPARLFVQLAKKFTSTTITVARNDHQANAKSILNLLTLGATMGTQITIRATGPDELEAVKALQELVESNFGEPQSPTSNCALPPPSR